MAGMIPRWPWFPFSVCAALAVGAHYAGEKPAALLLMLAAMYFLSIIDAAYRRLDDA